MIENKSERLTTLGFGIPNLLKFGEVGYFPEQFIVDFSLQGKTASEIEKLFISTGMDLDGDVMSLIYDKIHYFVDLKHNVFIRYDYTSHYIYNGILVHINLTKERRYIKNGTYNYN